MSAQPIAIEPAKPKRERKVKPPLTSRQQLTTTIKVVRDSLRKDSGLSGDTDRLEQLTWMLFLKALDDSEVMREDEEGESYEPIVPEGFRWRDWAAEFDQTKRLRGDELTTFVNFTLFPKLANLEGRDEQDIRAKVGKIFQGINNRVRSGYILREVVDKLSAINFNTSEDIHTVSLFYETMLQEVRNAAGDSGEFYTPRPVVKFMVDRLAPRLGERAIDPACGTCGFLLEIYERLKNEARTPQQKRMLDKAIMGIEKKPLPYLLGMMNLLLHGIENPNIVERNALNTDIERIAAHQQVDLIATNPPFGGEEEQGILGNFPPGRRTAETATLFFQYVMAMLKRPGGRCAIVLPNGFLFGAKAVEIEVKKELLTHFNLHTIVRLPNKVFTPYTDIQTNILFFDACEEAQEGICTKEVWYYEQPLPEGRSGYSKTKPLLYEEFQTCAEWWDQREENAYAWRVPVQQILDNDCNLDIKNPRAKTRAEHRPPEELLQSILDKEREVIAMLAEIQAELEEKLHAQPLR